MEHVKQECQEAGTGPHPMPSAEVQEENIDMCMAPAQQLKELLEEEWLALKNFEAPKLLQLLPVKQCLTQELQNMLESLNVQESLPFSLTQYPQLSRCLREINEKNQRNATFIESTLSFYQDFFRCVYPSSYASRGERIPNGEHPRGLRFSKEV